jgi:Tfp pilus assembly pilus retraction ATPase PilT
VLAESLRGTVCQRLVKAAGGTERVPAVEVMIVNGRVQRCILDPRDALSAATSAHDLTVSLRRQGLLAHH